MYNNRKIYSKESKIMVVEDYLLGKMMIIQVK